MAEYLIRQRVLLVGWTAEGLRLAADRVLGQLPGGAGKVRPHTAVAVPASPTDPPSVALHFYVRAGNAAELAETVAAVDRTLTSAGLVLDDQPTGRAISPVSAPSALRGVAHDPGSNTLTIRPEAGPLVLDLLGAHHSGDGTLVLLATAGPARREAAYVAARIVVAANEPGGAA